MNDVFWVKKKKKKIWIQFLRAQNDLLPNNRTCGRREPEYVIQEPRKTFVEAPLSILRYHSLAVQVIRLP